MGSKALILIAMVSLACAASAAEQMTTMEQLQNEGMLRLVHLPTDHHLQDLTMQSLFRYMGIDVCSYRGSACSMGPYMQSPFL